MMPQARKARSGFTLLELMVVVAIVGLIAGVVVACLAGGIRVWESARGLTELEQEIYFSIELFRKDTVNTFSFPGVPFKGNENVVKMPTILASFDDDEKEVQRVGTVKYTFDSARQALVRATWPFPQSEEEAISEVVAENVKSVRFSYLDSGAEDSSGGWIGAWNDPTNFPAAVSVELHMVSGGQVFTVGRQMPLMEDLWRDD